MIHDVEQLISRYLDGELTEDQQHELAAWIEADSANAARFAKAVFLDNRLHAELNAVRYQGVSQNAPTPGDGHWVNQAWPRIAAALTACVLIVFGVVVQLSKNGNQRVVEEDLVVPGKSSFASVAQVVDVSWGNANTLNIGDRLSAQTIQIRSGFVRLAFDDGVEVTLQGPAEYEILAVGKTRLNTGLLTATVPAGAEGFTVETPTAQVVDLGTAFGIDLRTDGMSHVSVFEGEVEVTLPDATEKRLLKEGDAVQIDEGHSIVSVEFDPEPFTKIWPVSSGIERSTEEFRFVPPWPTQQRFVRSNEDIFVAPEGHLTTLSSLLSVNVSSPGTYIREDRLTASEIPVGQRIRAFTLFFHPEKSGPRQSPKQVTGSITFDAPVLGLIVLHEELQASARRFSRHGPRNINERQQLELTGKSGSDVITLSEDRRTVTLQLTSPAQSAELMRVIVDASQLKVQPQTN